MKCVCQITLGPAQQTMKPIDNTRKSQTRNILSASEQVHEKLNPH